MDTGCFHVSTFISNAAMNIGCRYLLEIVISFHSDIYQKGRLLEQMVALFLISSGTSKLFSIVVVPIYIPTNCVLDSILF